VRLVQTVLRLQIWYLKPFRPPTAMPRRDRNSCLEYSAGRIRIVTNLIRTQYRSLNTRHRNYEPHLFAISWGNATFAAALDRMLYCMWISHNIIHGLLREWNLVSTNEWRNRCTLFSYNTCRSALSCADFCTGILCISACFLQHKMPLTHKLITISVRISRMFHAQPFPSAECKLRN